MRRVLLVAVAVLTLLVIAAVARVAASVFMVQAPPGWVADGTDVHGDPLPEGAIARLGTVRFRTTTWTNLCWLDDGRIASGGFDEEIVIWDGETGERVQVLAGHRAPIPELLRRWNWREARDAVLEGKPPTRSDYLRFGHIEQVGEHLISAGASVREWDLRTGAGRLLVHPRGGNVGSFDLLDDGNIVRFTVGDREYRVDRRTGKRDRRRLEEEDTRDDLRAVTPDGRWRVYSGKGSLTLRDTSDGSERTISGPRDDVFARCSVLSPEGTTLWCVWNGGQPSASAQNTLTMIDLETATITVSSELPASADWWWLSCSHDGRMLASSAIGGRTQLFDATTLALLREVESPPVRLLSPSFSHDDTRLALRIGGAAVAMFDVQTGARIAPATGHEASVIAATILDDGRVLTAAEDGTHRVWEMRTGRLLWTRHGTRVEVPAAAPVGDVLAVATETGVLTVRTSDGEVVASREAPEGWQVLGTAPGGTLLLQTERAIALLTPDDDTPREVVDRGVDSKATEGTRTSHAGWDVAGGRLLVADETRTRIDEHSWRSVTVLRMLDARDGSVLWTLEPSLHDPVVDFHGKHVAMAAGRHLAVFDGAGDQVRRMELTDDDAYVTAVAFSPDGERVATGDDENGVYVWSLTDGALLKTLRGHGGAIRSLTWSPDGTLLVSTSTDTTALVWNVSETP